MDSRKEPKVTERGVVIVDAALRKHVRKKLWADLVEARVALTPQRLWQNTVQQRKTKAKQAVIVAVRNNAPVIGAIGVGMLLVIARRPISKWIFRLATANRTQQTEIDRKNDE